MSEKRQSPYVYVTWLTKLLAGEDYCEWKSWFKAHYKYDKLPSDFNLTEWTAEHNNMTQGRCKRLEKDGYEVYLENQNEFTLRNSAGITLAGKPDIVAVKDGNVTVIDCKTGNPRHSDNFQVLIYMLILPHTHKACREKTIQGEVQYKTDSVEVAASKLDDEFRQQFRDVMGRIGGDEEIKRSPSFSECRFCDIPGSDCPERVEESPVVETDLY